MSGFSSCLPYVKEYRERDKTTLLCLISKQGKSCTLWIWELSQKLEPLQNKQELKCVWPAFFPILFFFYWSNHSIKYVGRRSYRWNAALGCEHYCTTHSQYVQHGIHAWWAPNKIFDTIHCILIMYTSMSVMLRAKATRASLSLFLKCIS